ncbi:replication initiation protein [Helicobacter salomonis]|uniref:replication initiation protein n=1 Tax=Helicobacter salomonis TaxID=56878 RepID=UPI000CF0EFE8|nr:replication initiation protein [Helicobacter salomonis]
MPIQEQALVDEIKKLQRLIETGTDSTLKGILEQKKDECIKKLVALTATPDLLTLPEAQDLTQESQLATPKDTRSTQENSTSLEQETQAAESKIVIEYTEESAKPSKTVVYAREVSIANPNQVVIHNDIYKVNLGKIGAWEGNLFFSLLNRLKDQQDTCIHFTPQEVRELIGTPKIDEANLLRVVETLWKNVRTANFWEITHFIEDGEELTKRKNCFLFRDFTVVSDKTPKLRYIEVGINTPYFTHLLNDLNANFTSFQLKTFMSLRSKYAKNLYRLLVRFEDVKKNAMCEMITYKNNFAGFKEFMGIPKGLALGDIEERVLKPACRELAVPFEEGYDPNNPNRDLPYETIFYVKEKKGRSHRVVGITFHFMPHPHASMQKAIFKRKTQNRIQNTLAQKQKEQAQEKEKQAQPKRPHYNKQERDTLNKFCGLIGPLFVTNPDYYFKEVKLVRVKTTVVGNPSIMCLFQLLDPKNSHDAHYAECHIESIQSFGNMKPPEYFTHAFVDHENFIESFVKNAH